jgi:hypothetical protein
MTASLERDIAAGIERELINAAPRPLRLAPVQADAKPATVRSGLDRLARAVAEVGGLADEAHAIAATLGDMADGAKAETGDGLPAAIGPALHLLLDRLDAAIHRAAAGHGRARNAIG